MSVEIAWKQNILVTDFHLLSLDLVRRHSSVDSADKTFAVYSWSPPKLKSELYLLQDKKV